MKKSIVGKTMAAAAALMVVTSPIAAQSAPQEPVKVGVIDLQGDKLSFRDPGTTVIYKEFTTPGAEPASQKTKTGHDHGVIVVSALVRQYRELDEHTPLEVYSANPFRSTKDAKGRPNLSVDFIQAGRALEWMSQNGVTVVSTSFNSSNAIGSKSFMDKAESLGIVVYASYANTASQSAVYPARDPRAISVVDTNRVNPSVSIRRVAAAHSQNVTFAMHGGVPEDRNGYDTQTGSSFSSAKAAAYGAYVRKINPSISRDQIVAAMTKGSRSYRILGSDGEIPLLGERTADKAFLRYATTMVSSTTLQIASKGPSNLSPATAKILSKGPAKPPVIAMAQAPRER